VTRFLAALEEGTRELAERPHRGLEALLDANPDLDERLQRTVIEVTTPYFLPKRGRPYGWMDPPAWRRFTAFMYENDLVERRTPEGAFTNEFLPPRD
jgi:hypothetical protein